MTHSIGAIARLTDISIATVRFYERRGLVPEPARNAYGHRQYDSTHVARIKFIRRSQRLGFSLGEIKELLELRDAPGSTCPAVQRRTKHRLLMTQEKLAELEDIRDSLEELVASCEEHTGSSECPAFGLLEV